VHPRLSADRALPPLAQPGVPGHPTDSAHLSVIGYLIVRSPSGMLRMKRHPLAHHWMGEAMPENYWTTSVSVGKSESEIRDLVYRFGASKYAFIEDWDEGSVIINFMYREYPVEFRLRIDHLVSTRLETQPWNTKRRCSEEEYIRRTNEQAKKTGMRILLNHIKASLIAVEYGLINFEDVFLSNFVTRSGQTLGEIVVPNLKSVISKPGLLLPSGK